MEEESSLFNEFSGACKYIDAPFSSYPKEFSGACTYIGPPICFKSFLWSGAALKRFGAKVQWFMVCAPRNEGGLGFKLLKLWNKATMLRHLWTLNQKADSLWVKWVHTYVIKNKYLWHMAPPQDTFWTLRKLFQIRDMGHSLVKHMVVDGTGTFLWIDN